MSSSEPPELTAFAALSVDIAGMTADPRRTSHWLVPVGATQRITELADRWARLPDAELILRQNIYRVVAKVPDTGPILTRALLESGMAGIQFVVDEPRTATHVSFAPGGEAIFQLVQPSADRRERISRLRDAMTALPEHLDHAFVRPCLRGALSVTKIDAVLPLPGLREHDTRYNKHLLSNYLPDAHGLQVVSAAHLENMHVANWHVADLGSGRYLVEAPDLAPWYASTLPNPDVLAQARTDFADALITKDVIALNPPPWVVPGGLPNRGAH